MKYQQEKFINALLFFAKETNPSIFGITKLLKLLFLSDFYHFQKYGKPILGDIYPLLPQGPVPSISYNLFSDTFYQGENTNLKKVARVIKEKVGDYDRNRIEALKYPDLNVFSKSNIEIMQNIAKKFYNTTGTKMVKIIHNTKNNKNYKNSIKIHTIKNKKKLKQ